MKSGEARKLAYDLKGGVMADIYPTGIREVGTVSQRCDVYIE